MMIDENESPGSAAAIALGCTCSAVANHDSSGAIIDDGGRLFDVNNDCRLHGVKTLITLLES
jgi:hypothetical protein